MKYPKKRCILALIGVIFSSYGYAFQCYLTLMKDTCWKKYKVSVDVIDASNNKKITTIVIPEKSLWARQPFDCKAKQSLKFVSSFTPEFWEKDVGKVYNPKRYWALPEHETGKEVAWNMSVCFPSDFSEVPLPPEANNHCGCDKSLVSVIKVE